jgi:hypothetical protein
MANWHAAGMARFVIAQSNIEGNKMKILEHQPGLNRPDLSGSQWFDSTFLINLLTNIVRN